MFDLRYLSTKIVLSAVVVLALILGVSTFLQWKSAESTTVDQIYRASEVLGSSIDAAVGEVMQKGDSSAVEGLLSKLGSKENTRRVYIVNGEGKLYRAKGRSGDLTQVLLEDIGKVRATRKSMAELRETSNGEAFLAAITPLVAEKRCIECHSDFKEGEIAGFFGMDSSTSAEMTSLRSAKTRLLLLNVLVVLIIGGAVGFITRKFTKPLTGLTEVARGLAEGEIKAGAEVKSNDEIGVLAQAFRVAATSLDNLMRECETLIKAAQSGNLSARGKPEHFKGAYANLVGGVNDILTAAETLNNDVTQQKADAERFLHEAAAVLDQVAAGELTMRITGTYEGSYAEIKDALNTAVSNLDEALGQVLVGADQVTSAADQISAGSQSLSQGGLRAGQFARRGVQQPAGDGLDDQPERSQRQGGAGACGCGANQCRQRRGQHEALSAGRSTGSSLRATRRPRSSRRSTRSPSRPTCWP